MTETTDPQADVRTRIAHALRSITTVGGCPPTRLVPVLDVANPRMARIADWKPLDALVDELLAAVPPVVVPSPPADRAAILREAAEVAMRAARGCGDSEIGQYAASVAAGVGKELRRMAGEAQQPETRKACACGQDGREYCDVDDDDDEPSCTCAAAGDCFAPAGHYADCPAAVSQPAGARQADTAGEQQ